MGFLLVANVDAGSEDDSDIVHRATERLPDVRVVELDTGPRLGEEISRAVEEHRVVVAAGGDGTVSAVVQHLVGRGTLGVLPGGTLNHFARDLGVRDLKAALETLERGRVRSIDVGVANGAYFVNNVGLGLYGEGVRERERTERRRGKLFATLAAWRGLLASARPLVGTIEADGDRRVLFAWQVFVGNNRFGRAPGSLGSRERLDQGVLDLAVLTAGPRALSRAGMAWRVAEGKPWQARRLVRTEAREVIVRLEGEPRPVSRDGEHDDPATVLEVRLQPRSLRVLAPT